MSKPKILELKEKIEGTVLYEDEKGTNGNVVFNGTIAEGEEIEIIYARKNSSGIYTYKNTGRIPFKNNMATALDIIYNGETVLMNISKKISITTTNITSNLELTWRNDSVARRSK